MESGEKERGHEIDSTLDKIRRQRIFLFSATLQKIPQDGPLNHFVAVRWLRHRFPSPPLRRCAGCATHPKRHGPTKRARHTLFFRHTTFLCLLHSKRHTLMASTFALRRLPSCRATLLSTANPLSFRPLSLRPAVALYSTRSADIQEHSKPYYITTPIFYVNAGTHQQITIQPLH